MSAKKLAAIRKDYADPKMSWDKLKNKYEHSVTTLRKHFGEERNQIMAEMAKKDEVE